MVTFIPKQPLPTTVGWYFGRPKDTPKDMKIVPLHIVTNPEKTFLFVLLSTAWGLEMFDWFGPVPEVQEANVQLETTEGEV